MCGNLVRLMQSYRSTKLLIFCSRSQLLRDDRIREQIEATNIRIDRSIIASTETLTRLHERVKRHEKATEWSLFLSAYGISLQIHNLCAHGTLDLSNSLLVSSYLMVEM